MKDLSSMPRMLLTAHASVENPDCSCLIVSKEKKKKIKEKRNTITYFASKGSNIEFQYIVVHLLFIYTQRSSMLRFDES